MIANLGELHGPGWVRLLAAARRRLETSGGSLTGSVGLRQPSDAERRVVIGITGTYRPPVAGQLRVPLSALDNWLRDAYGIGLVDILATVHGEPLRDRPADRRREERERAEALAIADASRHAGKEWFQAFLQQIVADGTLTRSVRRGTPDLAQAITVLDRIDALGAAEEAAAEEAAAEAAAAEEEEEEEEEEEAEAAAADLTLGVPLPVLAEDALGDTKALSGTPAAALVLRALAVWQGIPAPSNAEEERALWDDAGVIVDDLASQVLVLNLPARGGLVADWLTAAAEAAMPFRLTLQQLTESPVVPEAAIVYVCENPAILRSAAGTRRAPLICTEGVASVAARRLVAAAVACGAEVLWRNDFDWPGLRMTAAAVRRYGAHPWRMSAADYRSAGPGGTPLRGAPAQSPWDPQLAEAMSDAGVSVMEERLLPQLLADLSES